MASHGQSQQTPQSITSSHQGAGRQPYHHPHSSLGATGHWIKTAGILAPLVIGEFVKDADQRWRYIRIASVATALISEGLYASRIHREREQARQDCEAHR